MNAPDDVRVDRGRGWELLPITFADEAAVQRLARRLGRLGRASVWTRRNRSSMPGWATAPGCTPCCSRSSAPGSCLSLRVLRPTRHDLTALRKAGTLPGVSQEVVEAVLAGRPNPGRVARFGPYIALYIGWG